MSQTCRVLYQNKVEKECILLAFITRIYHEARSCKCQIYGTVTLMIGFGGLEVACWPLVPKFAGSNPAEAVGFLREKKSSEGK